MWISWIKVGEKFLHQHIAHIAATLRGKERQEQQGRNRLMHHVRRRPIPHLPPQQLDIPQDRHQETILVHEVIIPWYNGDGMQCFLKDLQEHMRPIHHSATKLVRALHKGDHSKNSLVD